MAGIGFMMLLAVGTCAGGAGAALGMAGEAAGAASRVTYGLAWVIVRLALAACGVLVVIYVVQLFLQRPRR